MMPSSSNNIPQSASSALSSSSSSTSSPCAACKFLRRKCQPDCVFAPYFPPDNPQKFVHVHRVFGASNVTKILNELPTCHREDAVNSLAYEADMRLKDPVYGCVGVISILQHQLRQLQMDLTLAKAELLKYQHPSVAATAAMLGNNGGGGAQGVGAGPNNAAAAVFGREGQFLMGMGVGRENSYYLQHHQQQQQLMMRNYEAEMAAAARMGVNAGGYDATGMAVAAGIGGAAANLGVLGGHFLKTSMNGGGEDRPSVGPS